MKINFYPESDKPEFVVAASEYTRIWQSDGQKIVKEIENTTKLKFKTGMINAVIFEGISYSVPMRLRSSYSRSHKEATVIHELLHRLLVDHDFWLFDSSNRSEDVHKIIDLVLYDVWVNVLGKKIADESKEREISYGDPAYKNAWDWALKFSKPQRAKKFKKLVKKYANRKPQSSS